MLHSRLWPVRAMRLLLCLLLLAMPLHSVSAAVGDPGMTATPTALTADEGGSAVTYDLALASAPDPATTVTVTLSYGADLTVDPGEIAFSEANWDTAQTISVTAVDDQIAQGEHLSNISYSVSGTDTDYAGLAVDDMVVTINDDDTAGIEVDPTTLTVSEPDGNDAFTVRLTSQPTETVSIAISAANSECTLSDDQVTLDDANWDTGVDVTVTAEDDSLVDGDQECLVTLAVASSLDPHYDGLDPDDVTVTVQDDDQPSVSFSDATYSVAEGDASATITATLSAAPLVTATVAFGTADDTATAGSDYTAASGTLTFAPGVTSQTFTVSVTDDSTDEDDETVSLTLSDPANATLGSTDTAALTITDNDDPPTVQFSTSAYAVAESVGSATVTATLSAASGLTATVAYATSDGTATAGSDYTAASGTLTFAPGVTSRTFTVPITDDTTDEAGETVSLALSGPSNATLGTTDTATLTIADNESAPTVAFSASTYAVAEGGGSAIITATLSAASGVTATVAYATSDGTATAGSDYTAAGGTLTFAPGVTSQTFTVAVTNDTANEADETVSLALSSPSNATLGAPASATLTITDNDDAPTVQFSSSTYTIAEGGGSATITATLSAAGGVTATVAYATANGTATAGSDYTAASGTLTFAPGVTTQTFTVAVTDDSTDEAGETVALALSTPSNATLGTTASATLTITDNDGPPTVEFSASTYTVAEEGGSATITATLSAASGLTATVAYATSDGTATAGADYTAASGTLTFAPGVTSQTFAVSVTDDATDEADETVSLTLSTPSNATLGTTDTATLTITDNDDAPTVQFSSSTYTVAESSGSATITATLSAASGLTATVAYATSDGTATSGSDYTAAGGTLTFAPGVTSRTFTVSVTDDATDEAGETVALTLSAPTGATLGATDTATLTITDNDDAPTVGFSAAAYAVSESGGSATITATLSAASGLTATVAYATSDGTATAGTDYTAAGGTLTFAPGVTTQTFTVSITGDTIDEANETIALALSAPSNATLGATDAATLTITDDDAPPTVQFNAATYTVAEGGGSATITATLSAASGLTATVTYATTGNTATSGSDYTAASGTLTFAPGVTSQTFTVSITDDTVDEASETVTLTLSAPANATLGATSTATLTITDNDDAPTVQFSAADYVVDEGAGSAVITVTLSSASGLTATVTYATANGTALSGSDYSAASGTLTFSPGATTRTFSVPITNDLIHEGDQTVALSLSAPTNATLGTPAAATLTIDDNDSPPVANFELRNYSVSESTATATLTVTISAVAEITATVDYASSNGTATAGSDYTAVSGTLSFPPGVTVATIDVPILADDVDESDETLTVTLSNGGHMTPGTVRNPTTLTITDDDTAGVQIAPLTVGITEGGANGIYRLVLASQPTDDVEFLLHPGSAQIDIGNGAGQNRTFSFTPATWDVTRTITVTAVDDVVAEGTITTTITHSVSSSDPLYDDRSVSPVTVVVQDNDGANIVVSPLTMELAEPHESGQFTVSLTSQPTAAVTVPLLRSNEQVSLSTAQVVLTSGNWETGVVVTVTARQDNALDGDRDCIVRLRPAESDDTFYDGFDAADVTVTVLDDGIERVYLGYVTTYYPPYPQTPVLSSISNSDADGNYTVTWNQARNVTTFDVQRASDASFSDATRVYLGAATSLNVTGRSIGTDYYRVRGFNSWGSTGWSAAQSTSVRWELEPNNTPGQANGPLTADLVYYGVMSDSAGTSDYYYIDLTTSRQVEVWLTNIPSGQDYTLALRANDGAYTVIDYSGNAGTADEHFLTDNKLAAGRYYIQVYKQSGGATASAYQVRYALR